MAFKKLSRTADVPKSPDRLLVDLPRRKIPDVLPHQREIMRMYSEKAVNSSDVALQLPTGSGKTLVGLMIAEWRRRKNQEKVVYLCPTRQLVNQVIEQAEEKYGLTARGFTGSARDYDPAARAEYRSADRVAVTTYSSLFNTRPFFDDADVLILDDVHAAEGYVASLWSVCVQRNNPEHKPLHTALCGVLKPYLSPTDFGRLAGNWEYDQDYGWVDKVPTPTFLAMCEELVEVLDTHTHQRDLRHPWSMIRDHLSSCHMYLSAKEILIRPLIPPTWTHDPFTKPKQRIYMSATLGAGGDLERLVGKKNIMRLAAPEGWDRQCVGRRFFIFPGMSLEKDAVSALSLVLMKRAGRSLVLVPTDSASETIAEKIEKEIEFHVFGADQIEDSKGPFVSSKTAVAVIANRYDGIDFPGDECRLLFIEGLPRAMNLQERFLMTRMGANVLFNERVQTRVLQAVGRCTRSLEDYSAVVVSGEEMTDYLADIRRRKYLDPELQAELQFGVEQSKGTTADDMTENFEIFMRNDQEWEDINEQIVLLRKDASREPLPAMDDLTAAVDHEISFQEYLWQGDYELALDEAEAVLAALQQQELRGYRATWEYLAGSAASLGVSHGVRTLSQKKSLHYRNAKSAASGIPWLVALSREFEEETGESVDLAILGEQLERIEGVLARLGRAHDRAFSKREKLILDGLSSSKKGPFEEAHRLLGEIIGFEAGNDETEGAPDPWWISGPICLVFEDHAGGEDRTSISVKKARQAASHPNWIRSNVQLREGTTILPILVTPCTSVNRGALPHLDGVAIWRIGEFRIWAEKALHTIREMRRAFVEPGDLVWRMQAGKVLEDNGLDAKSIMLELAQKSAKNILKVVG